MLYNLTALQTFCCLLPVMWAQNNTCNSSYVGALGRRHCLARMLELKGPAGARGVTRAVGRKGWGPAAAAQPGSQGGWERAAGAWGAGGRWGQGEAGRSLGEGSKPRQQLGTECPKRRYLFVVSVRMWAGRCTLCLPEEPVMLVCVFSAPGGGGADQPVPGEATSLGSTRAFYRNNMLL